jgi:hypothetical protein
MTSSTSRMGLVKTCDARAAELLLSYQGEYTTAGVMLLVNEAVRAGAEIGIDALEQAMLGREAAREIVK